MSCIRCGWTGRYKINLNKKNYQLCETCFAQLKYFFFGEKSLEEYTEENPINEKEYDKHLELGWVI